MPVNHSQEKVNSAAEIGFPMLIRAGENGQKPVVRRNVNRIIKLRPRELIVYPVGYLRARHVFHRLRIGAVVILRGLVG